VSGGTANRAGGVVIGLGVLVTLAEFANYYLRPAPLAWPVLYFASLIIVVGLAFTDSIRTLAASKAVRDAAETAGGVLGAFRGGRVVQAAIPPDTTAVLTRPNAPDVVIRDGEPPVEARQSDPPAEAARKVAKRKRTPRGTFAPAEPRALRVTPTGLRDEDDLPVTHASDAEVMRALAALPRPVSRDAGDALGRAQGSGRRRDPVTGIEETP